MEDSEKPIIGSQDRVRYNFINSTFFIRLLQVSSQKDHFILNAWGEEGLGEVKVSEHSWYKCTSDYTYIGNNV